MGRCNVLGKFSRKRDRSKLARGLFMSGWF
jgi:hypothetical protein